MDLKYLISSIFLIALVPACLAGDPRDICPPKELVEPCFCQNHFEDNHAMIRCEKISGNDVVTDVLNKTSEYACDYFLIDLSSLTYMPAVAFEVKRLVRLFILESTMVSLFNEPPKTQDLQAINLYKLKLSRAIQWDLFTGIPNLKNLTIEDSPLKSVDALFVQHAPKSLERITISNCSINKIEDKAFEGITNLTEIVMDHGKIKEIKRSFFPPQADRLKKISFCYQRIENLPEDLFTNMRRIQEIWFTGNLISTVSEKTFKHTFDIDLDLLSLLLDENPIKCNCDIKWITTVEMKRTLRRNLLGECEEPKNLHGTMLTDLKENHFQHCDTH